jgi:hypothetical protein
MLSSYCGVEPYICDTIPLTANQIAAIYNWKDRFSNIKKPLSKTYFATNKCKNKVLDSVCMVFIIPNGIESWMTVLSGLDWSSILVSNHFCTIDKKNATFILVEMVLETKKKINHSSFSISWKENDKTPKVIITKYFWTKYCFVFTTRDFIVLLSCHLY